MKQIFVDDDDEKALAEHRARRNAQVNEIRASEDKLAEQKRLAAEAAFDLPCSRWTDAHKKALDADVKRVLGEWMAAHNN